MFVALKFVKIGLFQIVRVTAGKVENIEDKIREAERSMGIKYVLLIQLLNNNN